MTNDSASGNKIKENKYKILRMSLILGNGVDREEAINNFEDAAREIDAMNDETYLRDLNDKFYDTLTLEEEEKKLGVLVDYIGGRAEQRVALINDFANVTGYELTNLPPIKYHEKLSEYKDRLKYIREYLDNTSRLEVLNKEVSELENGLDKTYKSKERAESRNRNDEKILLDKFKNIVDKSLEDIDENNIDSVLSDVSKEADNSKKSLDIFNKSFSTLEMAGISSDEEKEYASYVESAKENYYDNKEKEFLLEIYKLLINFEYDYSKILYKRDTINSILYERLKLRKELGIKDSDKLVDIYDLLERQYKNIQEQKGDIDTIDYLSKEINDRREDIKELELANQKVEILSLLKEFCIIDTYDEAIENSDSSNVDNDTDEVVFDKNDDNVKLEEDIKEREIFATDDKKDDLIFDSDVKEENNVLDNSFDNTIESNSLVSDNNSSTNDVVDSPISDDIFGNSKVSDINFDNTDNSSLNVSEKKEEIPKDNQVVSVKDFNSNNIDDIINKANGVMKRVGKMLGVEVLDNEKIVSVENIAPFENVEKDNVDNKPNDLFFNDDSSDSKVESSNLTGTSVQSGTSEVMDDLNKSSIFNTNDDNNYLNVSDVDNMSAIDGEDSGDINNRVNNDSSLDAGNLFFNNDNLSTNSASNSLETDPNDVFWSVPSEDGGLNELPDLPVNNSNVSNDNFFVNNDMPEFKVDFGNANGEA